MTKHPTEPPADPATGHGRFREQIHSLVVIAITAAGLYLCYKLAAPFLAPLAWALALAILFAPLQQRLESKLKRPALAASITLLVVILFVIVPIASLVAPLIAEAAKGAALIQSKVESGEWLRAIEAHPRVAPAGRWIEQHVDLPGAIQAVAGGLTTTGASVVRGSVVQMIGLLLTFYLLFYFLRDRREALASLRTLSPLSETEMTRLFRRVVDTVHATIYGTLAVAAVQGTLGGLMFWWLGLPAPLLWGIVMALLAVVPVLGAFVVWIPAAIYLGLEGSWGKAIVLTGWGAIVVGGIDNLLYPMLIGNRLKLHTVLAFIALVGGLLLFGPAGIILGPLALTITTLLLEFWRHRGGQL